MIRMSSVRPAPRSRGCSTAEGGELRLDSRPSAHFISQSYTTRHTTLKTKDNVPMGNTGFGATISSPG